MVFMWCIRETSTAAAYAENIRSRGGTSSRALREGRRKAERNFQNHIYVHGSAIACCGLKLPGAYILEHGPLNRRRDRREKRDAVELTIPPQWSRPSELAHPSGPRVECDRRSRACATEPELELEVSLRAWTARRSANHMIQSPEYTGMCSIGITMA